MPEYQATVTYDELIYEVGSYHYNWHPDIELLWLLNGEVEANVEGEVIALSPNDLLVINPNHGHATFAKAANSMMLRIHIRPDALNINGLDNASGKFQLNTVSEHVNQLYEPIRSALANLTYNDNQISQTAAYFDLLNLLNKFYITDESYGTTLATPRHQKAISKLTEYLEQHFSEDISLSMLAKQVNYSSTYLSKLLKSQLGITYSEYVMRCRLQQAIRELTRSTDNISSIAYQVGFHDLKVFNQSFRKHFGMTPTDYRKQLTPSLVKSDNQFKQALSSDNEQLSEKIIKRHLQVENNNSPCRTCEFREYQQKYTALMNDLQGVVKHN
ncbi:helix-turn-helix domain-containing protein [Companilactobacillus jidongensis]|uniref:helix-turn-helix domain-containing protein n=1 Tax=Companilactobacillus jidongensis TaxID=2486006 RepID=UPI000F7AE090|nr:AraC family transcriptional regulator [Companilactobacillus jidongensis]